MGWEGSQGPPTPHTLVPGIPCYFTWKSLTKPKKQIRFGGYHRTGAAIRKVLALSNP